MGGEIRESASRPRWSEGAMPQVRQEDENLWMLYPPRKPRPHFLNRTALQVLELCDGGNTVPDLVAALRDGHDNVSPERIDGDVRRCLHLFRTLGLVDWEEEDAARGQVEGFHVAGEEDFARIAEFIQERMGPGATQGAFRLNYVSVAGNVGNVYRDIALRTRQHHFVEIFFMLESGGRVRGVSALKPGSSFGRTMLFSVLLVDDGEDGVEVARELIRETIEQARRLGVLRVKMSLREEVLRHAQRSVLDELGFRHEARLLDELGDGEHVELWSLRTDAQENENDPSAGHGRSELKAEAEENHDDG